MEGKTNTKKKKKIIKKRVQRKPKSLLDVSDLGVQQEHVLSASIFRDPIPRSVFTEEVVNSLNSRSQIFHRPLASARVSFWLGVGFGTLVVGTLAILVWQLIRLDLIETVVLGLIR